MHPTARKPLPRDGRTYAKKRHATRWQAKHSVIVAPLMIPSANVVQLASTTRPSASDWSRCGDRLPWRSNGACRRGAVSVGPAGLIYAGQAPFPRRVGMEARRGSSLPVSATGCLLLVMRRAPDLPNGWFALAFGARPPWCWRSSCFRASSCSTGQRRSFRRIFEPSPAGCETETDVAVWLDPVHLSSALAVPHPTALSPEVVCYARSHE